METYRHPWDCKECDHIMADDILDVVDTSPAIWQAALTKAVESQAVSAS